MPSETYDRRCAENAAIACLAPPKEEILTVLYINCVLVSLLRLDRSRLTTRKASALLVLEEVIIWE